MIIYHVLLANKPIKNIEFLCNCDSSVLMQFHTSFYLASDQYGRKWYLICRLLSTETDDNYCSASVSLGWCIHRCASENSYCCRSFVFLRLCIFSYTAWAYCKAVFSAHACSMWMPWSTASVVQACHYMQQINHLLLSWKDLKHVLSAQGHLKISSTEPVWTCSLLCSEQNM